jgi:sulfite reductase alpha subunit-like flavoprotein
MSQGECSRSALLTSLISHSDIRDIHHRSGRHPVQCASTLEVAVAKEAARDWLKNTEFTTFGCGDSTYLKFNWAAKKVHKRFLQLDAREVADRGESDERVGFISWDWWIERIGAVLIEVRMTV